MNGPEKVARRLYEMQNKIDRNGAASQLGNTTIGGEAAVAVVGVVTEAVVTNEALPDVQEDVADASESASDLTAMFDSFDEDMDARFENARAELDDRDAEIESSMTQIEETFSTQYEGLSENVDTAIRAAGDAKTEAEAASDAALAAAGLAASKGETIVQVSAPSGSRANTANLWIDISTNADGVPKNQPNRYNPETTKWEPITDAQAVAAAQAAANAITAAQAAKDVADQANAAAGVAKQTAVDANTAALQAAGIANSKGKVIPQASKPTGANAAAGNLWIRTSDNTPWVYDPSIPDWVQVTDKNATDAAAAAVQAQQAATAAANAAQAAQATADSKPLILFSSTSGPSGTAPTGSTWFLWDSAKNIAGQWLQSGTLAAPEWTPQQITSQVIANLDLGKLTAGSAAIAELVAQKIAASTANFQTVNVSNLFVTQGATMSQATIDFLFANVVMAKKITAGMIDVDTLNGISLTGVTIDAGTFTSVSSNADGSSTTTTMLRGGQLQFQNRVNGSLTGQSSVYSTGGTLQFSNPNGYMMLGAGTLRLGDRGLSAGLTSFKIGPGGSESFTIDGDSGDTASTGKGTFGGIVQSRAFRAPVTNDASLTSTGHGFQVGTDDGANLIADNNEIMARNNGGPASLFINADGGNVGIGGAGSTVTVTGRLVQPGDTDWINFNATAGTVDTASPPQYRRVGGWVSLRGNIAPTTTSQTVGNLPAGFRPGVTIEASCVRGTGTTATPVFWDVRLQAGGNLALMGPSGGSASINLGGFPAFLADN
jgi:hypothetical protein